MQGERLSDNRGSVVLLALGLALAGWFVGHGFVAGRAADRFVEVKGLAEREVTADVALWPLRYVAASSDLAQAQNAINRSTAEVLSFLARHGIDSSAAELQTLDVNDNYANPYLQDRSGPRFVIAQTLMVRSGSPEVVLAASQKASELVSAGVILTSGGGGPTFLFTRLNDLKPDMIAEATANARTAAEQFARDSRSSLGGIRQANQGVFVILARDQAPGVSESGQMQKVVRVVSTIQYYLK